MFMIENLSDVFYTKTNRLKQEIVKASKITGLEDQNITQVMGDVYQNINLYDNDILVRTIYLYDKNIYYAESCAENYVERLGGFYN